MDAKTERYPELDSIRGLAALVVIILHVFNVFMLWDYVSPLVVKSPLRMLWSGHQAVIVFFIISGFVLTLPLLGKQAIYRLYLIKRICRIWIPYIVAVMIALCMRVLFGKAEVYGVWSEGLTFSNILNHVFLIGTFDQKTINPVVWSLVHEMRISIVFPIIVWMVAKFSWRVNILTAIILSVFGIALKIVLLEPTVSSTNYFITVHYISFFIIGSLLAKNRVKIINYFNYFSKIYRIIVISIGILLFSYASSLDGNLIFKHGSDWFAAVGGGIIIISALSISKFSKILSLKPILYIGKISYSLYLYHLFIILTVYSIFSSALSVWIMLLISICASLLLSSLSYYFVEKPGITFGKYIAGGGIREIGVYRYVSYQYHRVFRYIYKKRGRYQSPNFEYHHKKMKHYKS